MFSRNLIFAFTLAAGCSGKPSSAPPPSGMPPAPANLPPAPPTPEAAVPGAAMAPGATAGHVSIRGEVAETIEAPSYTYLRVTTASGDAWAAVPTARVATGQTVSISGQMVMNDFESKTLHRKFDKIVFGTIDGAGGEPGAPAPNPHEGVATAANAPSSHTSAPVPPEIGDLKVAKAEGADGHTIAEVYAKRAALEDKGIRVRGKVVKYTAGVMGKNWVHIRDATGTDSGQDNDLAAVTLDEANVGDTVTVKGTVHLDRDFGAGYRYAVIVEEAKLGR